MSAPAAGRVGTAVAEALVAGRAVVALESTLIAHGLPRPRNHEVARRLEAIVAAEGAVPATVAVVDGVPTVGIDAGALERIATEEVPKLSVRDLPAACAAGATGATTVSSTAYLAARAGVRVFATGGIGGVHRDAVETFDESADLVALSRAGVVVVCAGVKSILDTGATLERLETLGVPVVGYGTRAFPGFYLADSGHPLDWSVDGPEEAAAVAEARTALGLDDRALLLANPVPAGEQLDPALHDRVLAEGLARAQAGGVRGKDVTPYLLAWFHEATSGASLEVNIRIVERNAHLAARVAAAWSAR